MSALKKEKKEKGYKEIKRGKCPKPQKKRKSETRGKNGQVSDNRVRGTRYPPERKEKENVEHLILLKKFQKSKNGMYPLNGESLILLLLDNNGESLILLLLDFEGVHTFLAL